LGLTHGFSNDRKRRTIPLLPHVVPQEFCFGHSLQELEFGDTGVYNYGVMFKIKLDLPLLQFSSSNNDGFRQIRNYHEFVSHAQAVNIEIEAQAIYNSDEISITGRFHIQRIRKMLTIGQTICITSAWKTCMPRRTGYGYSYSTTVYINKARKDFWKFRRKSERGRLY